jgi:signal transduction histidine kinase
METTSLAANGAPSLKSRLARFIMNRYFWIVVALLTSGVILHYSAQERFILPGLFPGSSLSLSRHAVERVLLILPITYAAFMFGMAGGLVALFIALLIMLPRVFFVSPNPVDAFMETISVALVGGLICWLVEIRDRERRRRREELLRLQQRLSSAYQRMQTLYDVTKTVSSTLNLEEVLNLIAQNAAETMQVKACTIRQLDESGQIVDIVAAYGLSERYLPKGPMDIRESPIIYRTLSGQPTIVSSVSQDDRFQYPAEARAEGINSMLCVPLFIKGKAEGLICVYSGEADHFSGSDAEFLSALASEGATAIENARAYQALERADRSKSDFVQMVSHELRSPLSAVQSMLKVLEEGYVGSMTSKQRDLVQRSQRRVSALMAMVNDLLDLAAGKMEQLRGEKKEVVLSEIITKIAELVQTSAEEKGLELKVEVIDEPLILVGIEDGLERVFMNLVSNAVKYTPAGGSVAVRAWAEDDQIKAEVADTGIGIPEEALPRIFDEFYRAKNAKAVEMEGTGLGLAIAQDVVRRHGGQISVESVVGEGSTFCVILPMG